MTVIGIDQSLTSTGIAVLRDDGSISLSTVPSSPGQIEPRLLGIMKQINQKVGVAVGAPTFKPDLVVLEGLSAGSFGATNSVLELAALHYLIRMQLHSQGIPFKVCAPVALKKFVLGSTHVAGPDGKKIPAKKEHMLKGVLQRWGVDTSSNDEADAAGLAYVAAAIVGMIYTTNQPQREVVQAILNGPAKKNRKKKEN